MVRYLHLAALLTAIIPSAAAAEGAGAGAVDTRLTDAEFFAALDLSLPPLGQVKQAVDAGDLAAAKRALAAYYRARTSVPYHFDPHRIDRNVKDGARAVAGSDEILAGKGFFGHRQPNGDLMWVGNPDPGRYPTRMYWWDSLGKAYWATGDEKYARHWVWELRSFIRQCPPPEPGKAALPYWNTMDTGIRLRSGWPAAFHYFLHSPEFTDQDLVLFLKSVVEQSRFIKNEHRGSTNWVTFAMVGLYTSGALFPELKEAAEWRGHAARTAVEEMSRLYLPDGFGNELSPSYHQFFTNFWTLQELAKQAGRETELPADLYALSEKPCAVYVWLMTPDRSVPRFNDSGAVDVPQFLAAALPHFPHRQDFRWIATGGREGTPPAHTSHAFDYAGYLVMRSGWERDANYAAFDAGPPGNSHVHQDKLNLVVWAYGREVLFDIGAASYDTSVWRRYSVDTHSHNTIMVDGRPQRRRWKRPGPAQMPYQPLSDLRWRTTPQYDYAAGIYEEAYGAPGMPEFYPYTDDRTAFLAGWARPAVHARRVLFLKPDLFVVADLLAPTDNAQHTYQARWHLLSTQTSFHAATSSVSTTDARQPNLAVVPLLAEGLSVRAVSGQTDPEPLGWNALGAKGNTPATTVLHTRRGAGVQRFLTLLIPLRPGDANPVHRVRSVGPMAAEAMLAGGRQLQIEATEDPWGEIRVKETLADGKPGRQAP
ncbi:MAG: alginate lyase family protein [Armatimonadota bacterium]|nr:alginate lyase family protein [Armatimonadota bacterium]